MSNWKIYIESEIFQTETLSLAAKGMYGLLKSYENHKTKTAFPSLRTLEIKTGLTRKTVINYINELESSGLIEIERGKFGGANKINIYKFNEKELTKNDNAQVEILHLSKTAQVEILPLPGGNITPAQVEILHHNYNKRNYNKITKEKNKGFELKTESSEKSNIPLSLLKVSGFVETWETWINYRKESKKKLTVSTREMQLKNLLQWNNSGHDVIQIINNSIMNGWQGLFEPKGVNPVKKAETRNLPDLRELMIKEQNKENKL